jgi:hypothetical protein
MVSLLHIHLQLVKAHSILHTATFSERMYQVASTPLVAAYMPVIEHGIYRAFLVAYLLLRVEKRELKSSNMV